MIPERSARQAITLAGQGWTVSEIARHLGHDRKTVRIYLNGSRAPGQPRPHADSFAPFGGYVRQRAQDDRHLRAAGLHREITRLGYAGSYSAFTRELRGHGISAACGTCRPWKPVTPAPQHRWPRCLPVRVAPLTGETIASYLSRVAAACAARTGHREPVPAHLPAHQRACARHRIWLGRAIQIDLTAVPEIIHAHQRAFRLACCYGVTRFVLAEATARQQACAMPGGSCPHLQRSIAVLVSSNPGLDLGHPDTTEAAAYPETITMAAEVLHASRAEPPYRAGMTDTTFPRTPPGQLR